MRIKFERREKEDPREIMQLYIVSVMISLLISLIILAGFGVNPVVGLISLLVKPLSNPYSASNVVLRAIPLVLIGVGLALAFKAGFWNIGAEGQIIVGMIAVVGFSLYVIRGNPVLSIRPIAILLVYIVGFLAGGLWAVLPAYLKAKFNVNEVLTTLMMNYIAIQLGYYLIFGPWRSKRAYSYPVTDTIPSTCWLPLLSKRFPIHWTTLILAILAGIAVKLMLERTKLGYEIRVVGVNPEAARTYGIPISRTIIIVAFLSGGLAGLAGAGEIAGIHRQLMYPDRLSGGMGYTGILVAWLAGLDPVKAIISGFFIAMLLVGARSLQIATGISYAFVNMVVGMMLLGMAVVEIFRRYKIKLVG